MHIYMIPDQNERISSRDHSPIAGRFGNLSESIGSNRWLRHLAFFSIGLFVIAGLVSIITDDIDQNSLQEGKLLKPPVEAIGGESQEPTVIEQEETLVLKSGQSLIEAIRKAGVPSTLAHNAVNKFAKVIDVRRLLPGQEIHLQWLESNEKKFTGLWMRDGFEKRAEVVLQENGKFKSESSDISVLSLSCYAEGTIEDSLYLSAERAGVPAGIIVTMINLFSYDVDFQREIRPGDKFAIYFNRAYSQEFDDIRDDDILYAKLELSGNVIELNRFTRDNGDSEYYSPQGKSARKLLMKTPLDAAKITSSFNPNRKHPVLGYTRAHTGSDFRARTGTPIMAAGNGTVERASPNGTYGNYIRIRHNGTYETAYAHLSKYGKGIKKGARVKQGQIIGYAGATGRVTAAHLHYEVIVNGKFVNPMTLNLPTGHTLSGKEKNVFLAEQATQIQERETAKEVSRALLFVENVESSEPEVAAQ